MGEPVNACSEAFNMVLKKLSLYHAACFIHAKQKHGFVAYVPW